MTTSVQRVWAWATKHRAPIAGATIAVMAVVSTGQTAWYSYEQQKCNEIFAQVASARARWADQDRKAAHREDVANQKFWLSVYQHPHDRARNLALFRDWIDSFQDSNRTYRRTTQLRANTSLPDLADCD